MKLIVFHSVFIYYFDVYIKKIFLMLKKRHLIFILEQEKQSNAKQRHYDQEEVRRFMQKQKADRMKQQREEEKRKQRALEMRSQQLEELRSKQKQSAQVSKRASKSAGARSKGKDETFTQSPLSYKDLPRHHPFHEDLHSGSMVILSKKNFCNC